jgi:dihydrofolate reductase
MGKVILVMSMSLDGFITADNRHPEEPMGKGGEQLHEWAMGDDARGREILEKGVSAAGAVIAGRRTYDDSIPWWGADGPIGSDRLPVFVVSNGVPQDPPDGGVYSFVDGIEPALARAQAAASDKDVSVMGGADIAQQFIQHGLIDEIQIHLVPVLFGKGTRLFENHTTGHIQLETVDVTETAPAIHMRFRVKK